MIQSKYFFDILDKTVEGLPDYTDLLKQQLQHLSESRFEHTGVGLFINFIGDDSIGTYRVKEKELIFGGVIIQSSQLEGGGETTLWIKEGLIECLEIMCHGGDYPKKDPVDYKLIQYWINTEYAPNIINNIKPTLLEKYSAFLRRKRKP